MTSDGNAEESTTLSPEEAYAVLGNETRLQILETLGEAREPLAYSEVFDRIEYDDTANFTYHLDKLVGHFVRKTDDGYLLRLAGRRVVAAILSGVVTRNPIIDRTPVDMPCMYCGTELDMGYHDEVVVLYCSECAGQLERASTAAEQWPIPSADIVGYVSLPPAGIYDRTPSEVLDAAGIHTISGIQSIARGVCPQCTASLDRSIDVCGDHEHADGFCDTCDHQFAATITAVCTNCIFETYSPFPTHALANTDLMAFMIEHDIDPMSPKGFHLSACDEEILSIDPPKVQYTYSVDEESITLTVGEGFPTVETSRS